MKEKKSKSIFSGLGAWFKERVRRFFVALKKNPQAIPLIALCITFLEYSLNLTNISNTTAKIQGSNMGLCAFATMLFLILSFVCMLNAFPKRKKPNIAMMILMIVLYGVVIFANVTYLQCINEALSTSGSTIDSVAKVYIYSAYSTVSVNIVLVIVTIVCVILEPLFAKLFKKINTSIEIEGSGNIESIDITDED